MLFRSAESIVPAEVDLRDADAAIDTRLARILSLKEAGDERWKTELEAFINDYPDYELPASLSPPRQ